MTDPEPPGTDPAPSRTDPEPPGTDPAPPGRGAVRRAAIIDAAAELFSRNGYAAVGMDSIGAAAGVTGPAIYRHFDSKAAVLAAVFDRIIASVQDIPEHHGAGDPAGQLDRAIRRYAAAVTENRAVMAVFVREVHHLPDDESDRLRDRQRHLVHRWRELVSATRPEWDDELVRTAVHATFGLLNSVGTFSSPLSDDELTDALSALAQDALNVRSG